MIWNPLHWLKPKVPRFLYRGFRARLRDQRAELDIIKEHVRSGDTVCDIGAYKGSYVLWLSHWCRRGTVVAFEPQQGLATYLANMCRKLGLANVQVETRAVYVRTGTGTLYVPKDRAQGAGASMNCKFRGMRDRFEVTVPTVALDDYFKEDERVTLLKIDVEGAELQVFKGAERILRQHSPLLVFECENRHLGDRGVNEVFSYLHSLGYEGRFIYKKRLLPLSSFDANLHQSGQGEFWKDRERYCNNFVFAKFTQNNVAKPRG